MVLVGDEVGRMIKIARKNHRCFFPPLYPSPIFNRSLPNTLGGFAFFWILAL